MHEWMRDRFLTLTALVVFGALVYSACTPGPVRRADARSFSDAPASGTR